VHAQRCAFSGLRLRELGRALAVPAASTSSWLTRSGVVCSSFAGSLWARSCGHERDQTSGAKPRSTRN
jgi:hypothetical protein